MGGAAEHADDVGYDEADEADGAGYCDECACADCDDDEEDAAHVFWVDAHAECAGVAGGEDVECCA